MVKKTPLTTSSQVRKTQREEDSCYRRPLHTDWLKIQNFSDVNLSVMLAWNDELVLMFLNTKRKKQRFWFVRCSGAGGSREDFLFWSPSRSLGTGFRIELLFIRVVTTSEEAEYWFREPTDPQQQLAVNLRDAGLFTVYKTLCDLSYESKCGQTQWPEWSDIYSHVKAGITQRDRRN